MTFVVRAFFMEKKENISIIETKDGSSSLYVEQLNETYHSSHGAIQEAEHVFIENGIKTIKKENIRVLEVGFGTGLNAILTYHFALQEKKIIDYCGLETLPLNFDLINKLNYSEQSSKIDKDVFLRLHKVPWKQQNSISKYFSLTKNSLF